MPRVMERGWRERHIAGQADGSLPPGRIQIRHADGSLAFNRLGRPMMWSMHVEAATQPGLLRRREVERRAMQAAEAARVAEEGAALRKSVQRGLRPPEGKLMGLDLAARLVIGPAGGIGVSERAARTLAPLAAGGRHPAAALVAAGSWADEPALLAVLTALAVKLAVVGLRVDSRKAGLRMTKFEPSCNSRRVI